MLLDDFNLFHLLWSRVALLTQHHAADQLVNLTSSYNFKLVTSQDLVTRFFNDQESTLDLIFLFSDFSQHLVSCTVKFTLNYKLDHISVYMTINLQMISEPMISTQHVWKNMKVNAVFAKTQLLNVSAQLHTTANNNSYLLYIS